MISIYYVKDVAMQLVHVKLFICNHAYCATLHYFYLQKHFSTVFCMHVLVVVSSTPSIAPSFPPLLCCSFLCFLLTLSQPRVT